MAVLGRTIGKAAVLIVSWNGKTLLESCLSHLSQQLDPGCPWDIWVFDNGSKDGSQAWLKQNYPQVQLIQNPINIGFAEGVNQLVRASDADVSILLNNDAEPAHDWLCSLINTYREAPRDVAAVGGLALNHDGTRIDFMSGSLAFDGHAFQNGTGDAYPSQNLPEKGTELLFANGANMLIQTSVFQAVGGFDKEFFAYYEDVDLGWRLWAQGHRIIFDPRAVIKHRSKATSQRLGMFARGALYERNAFLNAYKNFDQPFWSALMPAITLTLLHRSQTLLETRNSGGRILKRFPLEPLPENAPLWDRIRHWCVGEIRQGQWLGAGSIRRVLGFLEQKTPYFFAKMHLNDPWTLAQYQAIHSLFHLLDTYANRRQQTQSKRVRSDEEIFTKFPLIIKATNPGDETFFNSSAFESTIPSGVAWLQRKRAARGE